MGIFGLTASEPEIFSISGPVDWQNPHHQRSVAASLVQGVYSLEHDRQHNLQGPPQALAPRWWDFFHFQLMNVLCDNADCSIFGAVYEFKFPPPFSYNHLVKKPPTYVVAFRGTMPKPKTILQDVKLDIKLFQNKLQRRTRVRDAKKAVEDMAATAGAANVWIAGHSLGSSIALLAGKHMAKQGCFVETYLFNPPFLSVPIEQIITNQKLKRGIRFVKSLITTGIAFAANDRHQRLQKKDSFVVLSGWIPYLFVNKSDPICSEYIGYFEHRLKMIEAGFGAIEGFATQYSIRSELSSVIEGRDSEPSHLLPSAYLTIHQSSSEGFKQAHEINQWWKPNITCQSKLYQLR